MSRANRKVFTKDQKESNASKLQRLSKIEEALGKPSNDDKKGKKRKKKGGINLALWDDAFDEMDGW